MKKAVQPALLDELYMMRALALARLGAGQVSPNPMVGAVIVKNGKIIGEGFHKKFGGPHAEAAAVRSCKGSVKGAALYVTLEPCNFFGKTPPCTDFIIDSGISRVIVGLQDPNPLVSGNGIAQLRKAGIKVQTGVLESECRALNEHFIKYITTGLPFVTLKTAQTLDGKIADLSGKSKWITNNESRTYVHHLRSMHDAVLIGAGTVLKDNPELTVRQTKGHNPLRIVLDGHFKTRPHFKIFRNQRVSPTVLITTHRSLKRFPAKKKALERQKVIIFSFDSHASKNISLHDILPVLGSAGLSSVLVEGGAEIFSRFMEERVVDKAIFIIAAKVLGKGIDVFKNITPKSLGNEIKAGTTIVRQCGNDTIIEAYLH
jgi:diaminohydroxyphosphoribosylaminopyrimidine deaminase/5-amino-6-(5-phosphoribosylamino)uracil reductase